MNLTANLTCDKLSNDLCYTTDWSNEQQKCQHERDSFVEKEATDNTPWVNLAEQVSSFNHTGFEFDLVAAPSARKAYTRNTTANGTFAFAGETSDLGFNTLGMKGGFGMFE